MTQNEIITALHAQLKEHAQRIFAKLDLQPGNYTPADIEKTVKLSETFATYKAVNFNTLREALEKAQAAFDAVNDDLHFQASEKARKESPKYLDTQTRTAAGEFNGAVARLEQCKNALSAAYDAESRIADYKEPVTISTDTFTASMPEALVFAKLIQWEREFKIKTADKAIFVKEEEAETIASCTVEFPKEAKFIAEYADTDSCRPLLTGVLLDTVNGCIVATDTHVLSEMPVTISDSTGEPMKLIIEPKIIKAVAGQRCAVKLLKDVEKNISIKTEKGEVYTVANIKGNYPNYRRVYPKVNRDGLIELTKESAKALANFAKATAKQTKDTRSSHARIKIEIPAYSMTGKATFYDPDQQREKSITLQVKESPKIDAIFSMGAFPLSIVTKNWSGSMWFTDPSRPVVFDNINTVCTVIMPMSILGGSANKSGVCAGVVDALKRHDYATAEAEEATRKDEIKTASTAISRPEKEECAKRYCKLKSMEFVKLTDNDEIIAGDPLSLDEDPVYLVKYSGYFMRSADMVLFDKTSAQYDYKEETPATATDFTPVINAVSGLLETLDGVMNEISARLTEIALEPLSGALEILFNFCTILQMCAKAIEIELLARSANISLEEPQSTPPEEESATTRPDPEEPESEATDIEPLQAPESGTPTDSPPEDAKSLRSHATAPPGSPGATPRSLYSHSFAPPGRTAKARGSPSLLIIYSSNNNPEKSYSHVSNYPLAYRDPLNRYNHHAEFFHRGFGLHGALYSLIYPFLPDR